MKQDTVRVEITNATRLAQDGRETEELYVGDVVELPGKDAMDLVGNGKAMKTDKRPGRHGLERFEKAEAAREAAARQPAQQVKP